MEMGKVSPTHWIAVATVTFTATLAAGGATIAADPPISAQGAVSSALGAPAQPKVAAPAALGTVTAGHGGADMDPAARAAALRAAIERCDLTQTLALGGSAEDAARIQVAVLRVKNAIPGTATWVQTQVAANLPMRLGLDVRTTEGGAVNIGGRFGDFAPPGGIASLPTATEAFGPLPNFVQEYIDLFMQGISAKDAADKWLARPSFPARRDSGTAYDPAQAYYMPQPYPGLSDDVVLVIPSFGTAALQPALIPLTGTKDMAGRADVLHEKPQIHTPDWVKDLPPPPPPPPPVTQC
jgi:hypothetical protein